MNNSERGDRKVGALKFIRAAAEVTDGIGSFYTALDVATPLESAARCDCVACRTSNRSQRFSSREPM